MTRRILRATISAAYQGSKTYATWNPADKSANITLSAGNLTASSVTAAGQSARSTQSFVAGKSYYCELKWNTGTNIYFGVGNSTASLAQNPGANVNSWSIGNTGSVWTNGISGGYTTAIATGGTIGLVMRWNKTNDTWTLYFRTTSAIIPASAAYANLTGTLFLMVGATAAFNATLNAGATAQTYELPDGCLPGMWTQASDSATTLYMATESFVTNQSDNIPDTIFNGRIAGNTDPAINREISVWIWGSNGSAKTSISELILLNQDGSLDYMKDLIVRNNTIHYEYANSTEIESTGATPWTSFGIGIMDRLEFQSNRTIKIVMGDKMALVDKNLTTAVYPSWLQQTSEREKSKPVCLGKAYMIDPILVEPVVYYYDCHDGVIWAVDEVTDEGDPDVLTSDYTIRNTGYDKIHVPEGKVAATIRGAVRRGSQLFVDNFTSWVAGAFDQNPASWTVVGESSANERVYQRTTGRCALKKTGGGVMLSMERNLAMVAGSTYVITLDVTYFDTGVLSMKTSNGAGVYSVELFRVDTYKRVGSHSFIVTPAVGQTWLRFEIAASATAEVEFESITVRAATHIQRLPDWIQEIVETRAGLDTSHYNATSLTTLDALAPYNLGYYTNQGAKIKDLLTATMDSFCGWIVPDRLGVMQVGRLQEPSATAVLSLKQTQIYDDIVATLDRAPGLSVSIGALKNWSRHGDGDFATSVTEANRAKLRAEYQAVKSAIGIVHPIYIHGENAAVKGTLLTTESDALNEAERIAVLMRQPRNFYEFTCILDLSTALNLVPGQTVNITYPRFDLTTGKNLIVVSISLRFGSQAVKLKLWG